MYRSDIDSRLNSSDHHRLITLAEHLNRWAAGGAAVRVEADGNFKVGTTRLPLQRSGPLLDHLTQAVARPTTLIGDAPYHQVTYVVSASALAKVDVAISQLFAAKLQDPACQSLKAQLTVSMLFVQHARHLVAHAEEVKLMPERIAKRIRAGRPPIQVIRQQYHRVWPAFEAMRELASPDFAGRPQLQVAWFQLRADCMRDARALMQKRARKLVHVWLEELFKGYLELNGVFCGFGFSEETLDCTIEDFCAPYEQALAQGELPLAHRAPLLVQLGEVCELAYTKHHYEVFELKRIIALGQRVETARQVYATIGKVLFRSLHQNRHGEGALYEVLLQRLETQLESDPWALDFALRAMEVWRPGCELPWARPVRHQHLAACFARRVYALNKRKALLRVVYRELMAAPFLDDGFEKIIQQLLPADCNDPKAVLAMQALITATEQWKEDLQLLAAQTPAGALEEWRCEELLTEMRAQLERYESDRQAMDEEALSKLNGVLGHFGDVESDLLLFLGEEKFRVHRHVLGRLAGREEGLLSVLMRKKAKRFELPTGELFAEDSSALFTPLLVGCLLSFLYTGQIPLSVGRAYDEQLTHMFSYLFPSEPARHWSAVARPRGDDWFSEAMQECADTQIVCRDGTVSFYKTVLESFQGALAQQADLGIYQLSCLEVELLLRGALEASIPDELGDEAWPAFLAIDKLAPWLVGQELWEERRRSVAERCLYQVPDETLVQALVTIHATPSLHLVGSVNWELERRLCLGRELDVGTATQDVLRLQFPAIAYMGNNWKRVRQFICRCPHLKQLSLATQQVTAADIVEIRRACPDLQDLRLQEQCALHPAVARLLRREQPEALPEALDDLTLELLAEEWVSDALCQQAVEQLGRTPQVQITIRALKHFVEARKAAVCCLDVRGNPHVDAAFLDELVVLCPQLVELAVDCPAQLQGVFLRQLPKLQQLRVLRTSATAVFAALKTQLPGLKASR